MFFFFHITVFWRRLISFYKGHIFFTDFFKKSRKSRKILIFSDRNVIWTLKLLGTDLDISAMMTLVAFCLEIRTSGTFISWKFKFLVKIVKICKKRKFKKLIKLCIKVLKKVKKTHLKRFFCQSTQDAALSTKSEAIQLNKGELQWNFYYPKFDFLLTFQKKKKKLVLFSDNIVNFPYEGVF